MQQDFFSLEQVIDRNLLTVPADALLSEVIGLMHEWGNSCAIDKNTSENPSDRTNNSCALVVKNSRLQGIFTERDLVKLVAAGKTIEDITVGEVMSRDIVTLTDTGTEDVFTALNLLRSQRIRHLPILNKDGRLLGLITAKDIRQKLQPVNLMKWRQVREVMNPRVIYASPDDTVRHLARLMADNQVSCVAICKTQVDPITHHSLVHPIGIITERDLIQYQNLNLNLEQPARNLMSAPLFLISPENSLWSVHQQMQQRRVRRLLVGGARGELAGIITQSSLLQVLDPTEMYGVVEMLQRQVCQLETERGKLLQERNSALEQEVQERAAVIAIKDRELAFHMNNSILAVIEWDSEFRVKRWSQRAEQMFGWRESEVMGKHWNDWQFVLEADSEEVMGITGDLLDGTAPRNISHNRNYTKDGSVIDCEWYNSVLLDEASNLVSILSLARNDTERQDALRDRTLAEQELKIRLEQQQVIAKLGQFALAAKDLISISDRIVDLVASTLNVEYCKVLELTPDGEELILRSGFGWHDGLVGNVKVKVDINSQAGYTLLQSQPVIVDNLNTETRFSRPSLLTEHRVVSGVSVLISDECQPYGILGVHTTEHRLFTGDDVNFLCAVANIIAQAHERQQAKTILEASEQKFNSILTSLNDVVWSIDPQTFKVLYMNRASEEVYGRQVAEFYNNANLWLEVVHPQDRERVSSFARRLLEEGKKNIEYRIVRPDGEIRWLLDRARIIYDENNQPLRIDGIASDISDRKRREKILKDIASGVSVQVGDNFFHSLVEFLSKTLRVDFAFVSKLIGSEVREVETLAVYGKGKNIDNFVYSLANTPCGNVIERGLCLYPEAVRQL